MGNWNYSISNNMGKIRENRLKIGSEYGEN